MKKHEIKIEPKYLKAILEGKKTFEIKKNDRDYQVGDVLVLYEFLSGKYTGRAPHYVDVTCISTYDQKDSNIVMAIKLRPISSDNTCNICELTYPILKIVPNHETGGNWLMCDHCKRVHQLKEMIKATIEVASVKLHHPAVDSDAYRRGKEHGIIETCKAMLKQIEGLS